MVLIVLNIINRADIPIVHAVCHHQPQLHLAGHIHDIGKNIVKVLLDNYGYTVVDLGRDVDPQLIVDTAVEQNITMIGLSALMTTTLKSMEDTIRLVRECKELQNPDGSSKCTIFVGGAVLTKDYAMKIGADYYCRDAKESVDTAKLVLG